VGDHDDSLEDVRLASRIALERDAAAEAALCRRLFPRIRAYGRRHLKSEAEASDLAQTVLVVVIEALRAKRVDDLERLPAFVMGAARNTMLDWKRGERRRQSLLEKFGPSFASVTEQPAERVDDERVGHCLEKLGPRERTIVTLTFFAERSADQIARELGMTAGSVRVARHRALEHLRACISEGAA
jgi:RNA polymerase sigma-70 factor (ECF subfamily)